LKKLREELEHSPEEVDARLEKRMADAKTDAPCLEAYEAVAAEIDGILARIKQRIDRFVTDVTPSASDSVFLSKERGTQFYRSYCTLMRLLESSIEELRRTTVRLSIEGNTVRKRCAQMENAEAYCRTVFALSSAHAARAEEALRVIEAERERAETLLQKHLRYESRADALCAQTLPAFLCRLQELSDEEHQGARFGVTEAVRLCNAFCVELETLRQFLQQSAIQTDADA